VEGRGGRRRCGLLTAAARVGRYQWEAHAEYCTHLRRATWAPHVPVFLRTAHLGIDMTQYGEGEGGGRQYIVWPFYCFLDRALGRGTAHALWHADRRQRQAGGPPLDY